MIKKLIFKINEYLKMKDINNNENSVEITDQEIENNTNETIKEESDNQPDINEDTQIEPEISFEEKYIEINDKYLRLSAEFDNYRKRTLKERMELIRTAGEDILINFLPVVDNFERAKKSIDSTLEIEAVKQGIDLIYKNLKEFLSQKGIKEMEAIGLEFDTEFHEALTKIPIQEEAMRGKVVDVIEKGYKLHDKVVRFAKVVVGE